MCLHVLDWSSGCRVNSAPGVEICRRRRGVFVFAFVCSWPLLLGGLWSMGSADGSEAGTVHGGHASDRWCRTSRRGRSTGLPPFGLLELLVHIFHLPTRRRGSLLSLVFAVGRPGPHCNPFYSRKFALTRTSFFQVRRCHIPYSIGLGALGYTGGGRNALESLYDAAYMANEFYTECFFLAHSFFSTDSDSGLCFST